MIGEPKLPPAKTNTQNLKRALGLNLETSNLNIERMRFAKTHSSLVKNTFCCSMCSRYMDFDFDDKYIQLCYNKIIIHEIIAQMQDFNSSINKIYREINKIIDFQTDEHKLHLMVFFEKLYNSILFKRLGMISSIYRGEDVYDLDSEVKEQSSRTNYSTGVGSVSLDTAYHKQVKYDVPRNPRVIIVSQDKTIYNFSKIMNFIYSHKPKSNMEVLQHRIYVNYLLGKIEYMKQYTARHPDCIVGRRNIVFNYLIHCGHLLQKISQQKNFNDLQIQLVEILGKSGLGKSQSVKNFAQILNNLVPLIELRDMIYVRSPDKWWNGYIGQPIVLYDDCTHVSLKTSKFDYIKELIDIGSGVFRNPPMAFAKDTIFTSSFCFITSNIPLITRTHVEATQNALKRRLISYKAMPFANCMHELEGCYEVNFRGLVLNTILLDSRFLFSYVDETIHLMNRISQMNVETNKEVDINYDFDLILCPIVFDEKLSVFDKLSLKKRYLTDVVEDSLAHERSIITEKRSKEAGGFLISAVSSIFG